MVKLKKITAYSLSTALTVATSADSHFYNLLFTGL